MVSVVWKRSQKSSAPTSFQGAATLDICLVFSDDRGRYMDGHHWKRFQSYREETSS